ncbi:MAG: RidA family protein [Bacteriovoracales bacterium]|nr:RidA family protein [Bacteriovoracales bacterium]
MKGSKDDPQKIISTSHAPAAVGTYSQGVEYNGVIYFSGQIGLEPQSGQMREGTKEQTRQILTNIDALLKACGLDRGHIIKTTVFLTNLKDFEVINDSYQNYFSPPFPARSCVEVSALPKGARVEIEVIASTK